MRNSFIKQSPFVAFLLLFLLLNNPLWSKVNLPEFFGDNMVLQQKSEVKIWGWAKPNEEIKVQVGWDQETYTYKTNNQGHWEVMVKTPKAGGPYTIDIQGYNQITLKNVLLGEVWICSGQSNMEWSADAGITNAEAAIAAANHPNIRLFTVTHRTATSPQIDVDGQWQVCTPETMRSFSAIAYFFAVKLQKELGVPVGLINSSWGGTPAETWMSEAAVMADPKRAAAAAVLKPVPWGPVETGRLYNAMIAPLTSVKIAGTLWYQGEGNTINAPAYEDMFSTLIRTWREAWGYSFPFYFAQIAPFRYGAGNQGTLIREAQRRSLVVPNTGMVVTSDIGDTTNIHPRNKLDVGLRMANLALSQHYKTSSIVASGPLFKGATLDGKKMLVSFEHAEGLHAKDGELRLFEIAGADGKYYPAKAFIKKGQVVVLSKKVRRPVSVRFAWSNTATPNLFNGMGLPASCFSSE